MKLSTRRFGDAQQLFQRGKSGFNFLDTVFKECARTLCPGQGGDLLRRRAFHDEILQFGRQGYEFKNSRPSLIARIIAYFAFLAFVQGN